MSSSSPLCPRQVTHSRCFISSLVEGDGSSGSPGITESGSLALCLPPDPHRIHRSQHSPGHPAAHGKPASSLGRRDVAAGATQEKVPGQRGARAEGGPACTLLSPGSSPSALLTSPSAALSPPCSCARPLPALPSSGGSEPSAGPRLPGPPRGRETEGPSQAGGEPRALRGGHGESSREDLNSDPGEGLP